MNKNILILILVSIALLPSVNALVLSEKTLTELGFTSINISGPSQTQCDTFNFEPFDDYTVAGNDTVLTLNITTLPQGDDDSNVSVWANDELIQTIHTDDLFDNGNIHVLIPTENQSASTEMRICASTAPESQRITVQSSTKLGLYQQPRFDTLESFQTIIAGSEPVLGDEISIQVIVKNHGGEAADVVIDYRKYELDYVPLLKGETGFTGIILPGETKTLTYSIKPLRAVSILLPPAVLTYTNIFGEIVVKESTRPFLLVEAPEFNVRGAFLVPQVQANVNEPLHVEWVAQNDGIVPVYDLVATYTIFPNGSVNPSSTHIQEISPSKAVTESFTVTFTEPGIYTLGCYLSPRDDPSLTTHCQSATIEVIEPNTSVTLLFSLLLLLIAMAVYAYIYVIPHTKTPEPAPPKTRFQS